MKKLTSALTLSVFLIQSTAFACPKITDIPLQNGGQKIAGLEDFSVENDTVQFAAGTGEAQVKYRIYPKYDHRANERMTCLETEGLCKGKPTTRFCFLHTNKFKTNAALQKFLRPSMYCGQFRDLFSFHNGQMYINPRGKDGVNVARVKFNYPTSGRSDLSTDLGEADGYATQLSMNYDKCMANTREKKPEVCYAGSRLDLTKDFQALDVPNNLEHYSLEFKPAAGAKGVNASQRTKIKVGSSFYKVKNPDEYPGKGPKLLPNMVSDWKELPNAYEQPELAQEVVHTAEVTDFSGMKSANEAVKIGRRPQLVKFKVHNMDNPEETSRGLSSMMEEEAKVPGVDIAQNATPIVAAGCHLSGGEKVKTVSDIGFGGSPVIPSRVLDRVMEEPGEKPAVNKAN